MEIHLKKDLNLVLTSRPFQFVDVQKASANTEVLMIEILLPELKSGEYELEIEILDENTLARSFVRKFLVKK